MASIIPNEKIEQVRIASDIVDVVSGYLTLKKQGQNFFGICPFHQEKTPSFSVNPAMQIFHCFGCGAGGNVFTFIMRIEGVTFPESVKLLAQAAGIVLPEEEENIEALHEKEALFFANKFAATHFLENLTSSPQAEKARSYLANRGITAEMYEQYGIGYALAGWDNLIKTAREHSINPARLFKAGLVLENKEGGFYDRFRDRVTFAVYNLSGQIVAFGARRLVDDDSPKYINSPETDIYQKRFTLYGLYWGREHIRKAEEVVIVEGYTDLISLSQAGLKNVVATSGTALTEEHVRLLKRYTPNAILLYDSDSAGAAAAIRGADLLLENGMEVRIAPLPPNQDPDEFARQKGEPAIRSMLSQAMPLIDFKIKSLEEKGLLRTAAQRADSTRNLLSSISKIKDHIQRSFIVRDLADRLHVDEAVMWSEIRKYDKQNRLVVKREDSNFPKDLEKYFETRRGSAELGLLEYMLLSPHDAHKIFQNVSADDLKHGEIRHLFKQVQSDLDILPEQDMLIYLSTIKEPLIAQRLSQTFTQRHKNSLSWKFAVDCIKSLQLSVVDEEIETVRNTLRGNRDPALESEDMTKKLLTLYDRRKRVQKGEFITEN